VAGGWRRLHNEELHNLYASPDINKMIRSRMMRWRGHVARIENMKSAYNIFVGKTEWNTLLEDLDVDCITILEWVLEKSPQ
jgi:hypothetical protein